MTQRSADLDLIAKANARRQAARAKPERPRSTARRGKCCWPKCGRRLSSDVPLCGAHLQIASELYAQTRTGQQPVMRRTVVIGQPEAVKEKLPQPGFVYYLRSSGFIKIGWTSDLTKRMKGYPPDSVLLAVEPGTRQDETRRHRQFAHHRTHGREWYTMAPSVMHHIDFVTADHGYPEPVAFSAQPVGIPQTRPRQTVGRPARGARHVSG